MLSSSAFADSTSFPVQGYIVDSTSGEPLDGLVDVTFRFYQSCDDDEAFLTESQSLTFDTGIYSTAVAMGDDEFATIVSTTSLCLGIQIGSDDEFSQRVEYYATPYAVWASKANSAALADVATVALALDDDGVASLADTIAGSGLSSSGGELTLDTASSLSWSGSQSYSGQVSVTQSPQTTASSAAAMLINPTAALTDGKLLALQDNGTDRFSIDKEGDVVIAGLVSCDTIDTDSNGKLACGSDSSTSSALSVTTIAVASSLSLEDPGSGTSSITFAAPTSLAASFALTWPSDDGSSGQVLTTSGAGSLSWATPTSGDVTAVTAGTGLSGGGDSGDVTLAISGVDASLITGSIADSQVSDVLTVGASGSVNDAALSVGIVRVGSVATITADWLNTTNPWDDSEVSDTITVGSSGSVHDSALSNNVSKLGSTIESSEITDGTITNDDITDVAASKITGSFSTLAGAGLSDCDGSNNHLLWDSATSTFSCSSTGISVIEKDSDESTSSDSTLSSDSALQFAAAASTAYVVEIVAYYSTGATPDFKYAITAPTSSTIRLYGETWTSSTAARNCNITVVGTACSVAGSAADWSLMVRGIVTTSTTSGTVALQWAQNTSDSAATTVYKNSVLRYSTLAGAADLAEVYFANDAGIKAGDVVSLDASLEAGVKKSARAYDDGVIGIVSTKPGYLLGDSGKAGLPIQVALAGRVPVKVTTHAGRDPIKPGDYVTAADLPGIAMLARSSGQVLGKALTGLEAGDGTVMIFIEQGFREQGQRNRHGVVQVSENGEATVDFIKPFDNKPVIQLTAESVEPTITQITAYLVDDSGRYDGFVIGTFSLQGERVSGVDVHWVVEN